MTLRTLLLALAVALAVLLHCRCCHAFTSRASPVARPSTGRQTATIGLFGKAADEDEDRSRPNIVVIRTHEDYVKFLEEDDRLCIIKYYATWCKSCQRFGAKYRHLAFDEGDRINSEGQIYHTGSVRFAEVEYAASAKLCKTLRVKKLPTVHMHRKGSGRIADICCKPSQFQIVVDEVHRLLEGEPAQSATDVTLETENKANATSASFDTAMSDGSSLADEIATSLQQEEKKVGISMAEEVMTSLAEKEGSGKKEKQWFPFTF
ncbi:hypothetical protein ACHAXT_008278 [Thalassiosira profunda]